VSVLARDDEGEEGPVVVEDAICSYHRKKNKGSTI